MKTTSSKNTKNESTSSKPFFNKGGDNSFFSKESTTDNSFFNASNIQASMTVGQPDDPFEQEAEKVSRQVVDGFDQANSIQRKFSNLGLQQFTIQPSTIGNQISKKLQKTISRTPLFVQAKCDGCEEEEKMQQKSDSIQFAGDGATVSPNIESQIQSMKGGGQGMDSDTKTTMESSFGADFSGVRVHTNSQAVQMSQGLNAHAFTVGNDIFFNEGRYQPHTKQGAGLLAHELTHTVQQGASLQNKRINTSSLINSLSAHSAAHLSAISGSDALGLSKKEMAQLEKLPEEEMLKMQQMQMLQTKGVDEVQKKDSSLKLRRCTPSGRVAPVATPVLRKTTVAGPTSSNCGGANWGVQWSIDNATTATDGWIVQNVNVAINAKDCTNVSVDAKAKTGGGFDPSWFPFWEAWQVRGGNVFVGGSTSAHSADTYNLPPIGDNTKGTSQVTAKAEFFPGATLPTGFTPRNSPPAMSLPYTQTNPSLTGGTGALDHNMTATWDCCQPNKTTTVTTV